MHAPEMMITCTAVRVPVAVGHSEAVHMELTRPITADAVRQVARRRAGRARGG